MMRLILCAGLCGGLLLTTAPAAWSQVMRCVHPVTKKVTYTDAGCASSEAARPVQGTRASTQAELDQQELDAAIARARIAREQYQVAAERRERERPSGPGAAAMGGNSDCVAARRNVEVKSSARAGVPEAAISAMDSACGGYTPRAPLYQSEYERRNEAQKAYRAPAGK